MAKPLIDKSIEVQSTEPANAVASDPPARREALIVQGTGTNAAEINCKISLGSQVSRHQRSTDTRVYQANPRQCIDPCLIQVFHFAALHGSREFQTVPDQAAAGLQTDAIESAQYSCTNELHVASNRKVRGDHRTCDRTTGNDRGGPDESRRRAIEVPTDIGAPQADMAKANEALIQQHITGNLSVGQTQRLARSDIRPVFQRGAA